MLATIKRLALATTITFLVACGGGSDGIDSIPVDTTSKFNLKAILENYVKSSGSNSVTISGVFEGVEVAGSGTITRGSLQSTNFEGSSAFSKTESVTITLTASGQSATTSASTQSFFTPDYRILGATEDGLYSVVTSYIEPSTEANANDTGVWFTQTRYANSSKLLSIGTTTATFTLVGESDSSAFLTIIITDKSVGGTTESVSTNKFRVTTSNTITPLSETFTESGSNLIITYR